jgi:hypothetical protein
VGGGLGGQGAGEGGVDGPESGRFAGVFGQAEEGGQVCTVIENEDVGVIGGEDVRA